MFSRSNLQLTMPAAPDERARVQRELNRAVLAALGPISAGLTVVHIGLALKYSLIGPAENSEPLVAVAASTAILLLLVWRTLWTQTVSSSLAHPLAAGLAGMVLINILLHFLVAPGAENHAFFA